MGTEHEQLSRRIYECESFLRVLLEDVASGGREPTSETEPVTEKVGADLTGSDQPRKGSAETGARVFIVHGHDDANLLRLERLLKDKWRLEPIVLTDRPGRGRTIIEKFESEAPSADFAFVLLTPDDIVEVRDERYAQARPNVIFELGWFYGHIGREKTCVLRKGDSYIPSDLDGIGRIDFGESIEEAIPEIERELAAANLITTE